MGLPEELTNAQGQIVWQASYKTWGNTVAEQWQHADLDGSRVFEQDKGDMPDAQAREQNLRFQGQYLDRDTGLHYNTFRYYDPDIGRFISPDPIGLEGGINLGSYSPNPISWIDPWGWNALGDTGIHKDLKNVGGGFQSHHLNQDAAFRDIIPTNEGATTLLRGNAFSDIGSSHYEAHRSLEGFWDQFRKGGARYGELPTNLEYTKALANSLRAAGLPEHIVKANLRAAISNRVAYGLLGGQSVPRIPGRINQRKGC